MQHTVGTPCLVQFLDPNQLLMEIYARTTVKGIVDVFEKPDTFASDQQQNMDRSRPCGDMR